MERLSGTSLCAWLLTNSITAILTSILITIEMKACAVFLVLAALNAEPESSAMVGDHPMDIFVGKDMGTYTIGVLTGYAQEDMLRDAGADIILETATNIKDLI